MKNSIRESTINNARNIKKDENCKQIINEALDFLSIVSRTLGPGGLPIFIERKKLPPLTTKDGVTVAKELYHPDRDVNTLVQSIKEASIKTNDEAGDGTTSAVVLTDAIYKEAMKFIDSGMSQPNDLVNEITEASKVILEYIDSKAIDIKTNKEKLKDVAYISCNGDSTIADVVIKAFDEVGEDGVITVDEGTTQEATLRVEEGYQINRGIDAFGAVANCFLTNEIEQEAVFHDVKILCYGGEITDVNQLAQCLQAIAVTEGTAVRMPNLAIIAYDIKGPALNMLVQNRVKAGLPLLPIQLASCGTRSQENMIRDIAIMTGGKAIFPSEIQLGKVKLSDLGSADKIVSNMKKRTTIFGPHGSDEDIIARMEVLKKQLEDAEFQYDKDNIRERMGKLVGGIAVIGIGGSTDLEMKERKARVEDAIHATRAALEDGVVPGGGATLLLAAYNLQDTTNGAKVLKRALLYPIRQVISNIGLSLDGIVSKIESNGGTFDARKKVYVEDAIVSGIIDPVKVVKSSFTNALSIAKELIKSGGIISYVKQPELDDQYHNIDE